MAHWTPIWLNLRSRWKTVLTAGLAGLLTASLTQAQPIVPDGFGGYYDPQTDQQQDLYDWSQDYLDQELERGGFCGPSAYERAEQDRIRARESCNALTNNVRARELCLQGLR